MSTLARRHAPNAIGLRFGDSVMNVSLADGREISVPLEWFPRLRDASPNERANCRIIGRGESVHWPDLDEDVSVFGLLGLPS